MNHSVGMLENSDQYQTLVLFIENEQNHSMPEQLPEFFKYFPESLNEKGYTFSQEMTAGF